MNKNADINYLNIFYWNGNYCVLSATGGHGQGNRQNRSRHRMQAFDGGSSVLGSDIESVSVIDSEDTCSRYVDQILCSYCFISLEKNNLSCSLE